MDTLQALKQVHIFNDIPDSALQVLASVAEERSVSPGEDILSPGDVPNAMFVIRNGTVRVVAEAREKTPPFLFGSGETIGEVPFLDGGPVAVTVTALERADLLVIRAQKLAAALDARPEAGYRFYRALAVSLAKRARRVVGMLAFAKEREGKG